MALTTNIITNIPQLTLPIYNALQQDRILPYFKDTILSGFGTNTFSDFIEKWADTEYICYNTWKRVEEQYDAKVLTVNAATISPTGTTLTITSPYKISGTYTNVQPGYSLAVPSIGKILYVVSVNTSAANAFTMVVRPNDVTYTGAIPQGATILVIPLNSANEGSCDIGNSSSFVPGIQRSYKMGIFRRRYEVTRTAAQSFCEKIFLYKSVVNYGDGCKTIDTLWSNDLENMYQEFRYGLNALRLIGEDITNTNIDILQTMTGLIPQLRAKAQINNYTKSAGWTTTNFDNLSASIKKKRGYCNEYFGYGGMNWRSTIDNNVKLDFPNGAISYAAFEGLFGYNSAPGMETAGNPPDNGKQRAIAYGFSSVQKDGITYHLHDEEAFNDESFLGATGFNYPDTYFMMPGCPLLCGNEYKTGLVLTYLGDNGTGTTSSFIMRDFGILREGTYKGCDNHTFDVIDEEGFEVVAADRWIFGEGL